tara:strand:- start:533 stop:1102 length:570 start_codon:yes stop_codon:yes gene_type:complete
MSEPNVDYTVEEDGGVATEAVDEHVFELKERPKKGRAPMSEERKAVLREQLKAAREKKKALKLEGKEVAKAPKVVKVLEATETEPAVYVKNVKHIKDPESEALKKELAEMKKAKIDEARIKLEKKEAAAAKRLATKERKALQKKMDEVKPPPKVDRPKPKPVEVTVESVAAKPDPRYSTYKKSIWEDFK